MRNLGNVLGYYAEGEVKRRRFVVHGTAARSIKVAAAATDKLVGISTEVDVASTGRCDVQKDGVAELMLGGTVAKGDFLTSDANGAGVVAATGNRYGAIAEEDGVSGDQIQVTIFNGKLP